MAKSSTCNISIRMDSNLKAAAEALYEELGMKHPGVMAKDCVMTIGDSEGTVTFHSVPGNFCI